MGDVSRTYKVQVTTETGRETVIVHAGSDPQFTVSGDLLFEDEARSFQICFGKGHWISVEEIKESN